MANPNDPNDPNNQNSGVNIINQPNQPMIQANQPFQNRQRGTGFTNINRILGANVGAGGQLASRIGGAISGQGARVRQGLGQAQQQFQTGFQKARNEALANIGAATALAKQPGESDEQYEARVANQNTDYAQVGQNLRSTSYTGPTGFENPNALLSQAQTAGKLGTFARSGLGQGILARQYGAGRGNYGIGQNIIDQMLLNQDANAQLALQQARQNVVGLGEGVQSAASAAQEAAQATQSGVDTAKGKAAEDIQKSTQGILARAGQSAVDFNKQMESIKRLLSGVDEAGNPITDITPEQQALLDKMSDYGLENVDLYMGKSDSNENQIQDIMNQLASGMVLNASGSLNLSDTQRQAAINLARLQNDPMLQQKMLENKFDKQVFKKDISKITDELKRNRISDKETRDVLQRAGEYMKKQEDIYTAKNQQQRDLAINSLPSEEQLDIQYGAGNGKIYRDMAIEQINKDYETAQRELTEGITPVPYFPEYGFANDYNPNYYGTGKQATQRDNILYGLIPKPNYTREFDQDYGAGRDIIGGLREALGPYASGWLAYGDRSPDIASGVGANEGNIDPRFAGLGLGLTAGRGSGGLRTSRDFLNAASKAMGTSKSVKDFILERIAKNRGNV